MAAAAEVTNGCGSTSGEEFRGASYFVVGLHIDFGAGFDTGAGEIGRRTTISLSALTRYKLTLLKVGFGGEVGRRPLRNSSFHCDGRIDRARDLQARPGQSRAGALIQVRQFLWLVNAANYTVVRDVPTVDEPLGRAKNYNGEHLMRGENIAFTLQVKVVPYKPVP